MIGNNIKKSIFFLFFIITIIRTNSFYEKESKQCIVVLDPAGDAKKTGRSIGNSFERGLTLQCAEKIKEIIELQTHNTIKVIITRLPGDIVYELQNASLANRIDADLFLTINFYQTHDTKPTLYVYHFSYGNDFEHQYQSLSLNTYDQAYMINKKQTDAIVHVCKKTLSRHEYNSLFTVAQPYSLPIKPLIGIMAPSIAIEAGLKNKESWHNYAEPIAATIIAAIEYLREQA
jgi:N-acetylmuramoyl-L-alanine amidase